MRYLFLFIPLLLISCKNGKEQSATAIVSNEQIENAFDNIDIIYKFFSSNEYRKIDVIDGLICTDAFLNGKYPLYENEVNPFLRDTLPKFDFGIIDSSSVDTNRMVLEIYFSNNYIKKMSYYNSYLKALTWVEYYEKKFNDDENIGKRYYELCGKNVPAEDYRDSLIIFIDWVNSQGFETVDTCYIGISRHALMPIPGRPRGNVPKDEAIILYNGTESFSYTRNVDE